MRHRLGVAELLALAGACSVAVSPSLAWYVGRPPGDLMNAIDRSSSPVAPFLHDGLEAAFAHVLRPDGWKALHGASVALLLIGIVAALALAFAVAGHTLPTETTNVVRLAGLAALGVALYHVFRRPLPHEILGLGPGAYAALAGGGALVVCSLVGAGTPRVVPPPAWQLGPPPIVR